MRLRSDKHKSKFAPESTQTHDSQSPPGGETAKIGDDSFCVDNMVPFDDTMPFNDTVPFDDTIPFEPVMENETQVLNLEGETQVLDIPDYMETQLIDDFDTQVVDDSEDEGTDRTEVVDSDYELLEDKAFRKFSGGLNEGHVAGCTSPSKEVEMENLKLSDDSSDKDRCSGPAQRNFTSVCAASLRASGLTALNKGRSSGSYSALGYNHSSEENDDELHGTSFGMDTVKVGEGVDQEHVMGIYGKRTGGLRNDYCSIFRTSAVRRLFSHDTCGENEGSFKQNQSDRGDLLQFPANDDAVAGLSYIDSQEPGDLSQANALEFVDKFLQENVDTDQELELGKSTKGKSKTVSTAKGPQSLAKRANAKSSVRGAGVFDWDDNKEDECGGDIFRRKKEEFFGNEKHCRQSLTEPQKSRSRKIFGSGDKDRKVDPHNKVLRVFQSDSKVAVHNVRELASDRITRMSFRKNLIDELNGNSDANHLDGQTETTVTDDPQMIDVGFDTQLAAEAMEALCDGEAPITSDVNTVHDGIQNKSDRRQEDLNRRRTRKRVYSKPPYVQQRDSSYLAVPPRQTKVSKKFGARVEDQLLASSERQLKNMSDADNAISNRSSSEKKQRLQDAMTCSTPFAHCTRRSGKRSSGTQVASELPNCGGRSPNLVLNQSKGHVAKQQKHEKLYVASKSAVTSRPSVSGIEMLSHPKRRRSCRLSSGQINDNNDLGSSVKSCVGQDCNEHALAEHRNLLDNIKSDCVRSGSNRRRFSSCTSPALPSADECLEGPQSPRRAGKFGELDIGCNFLKNGGLLSQNANEPGAYGMIDQKNDNNTLPSRSDQSPNLMDRPLGQACTTPSNPTTPAEKASPICMGDEYLKDSCKKNFSRSCLLKELRDLTGTRTELDSPLQNSRRRRDISNVRVLYSHHLDKDVMKQQKKKLSRLGVALASSIGDATHFVTDKFVRTKNMLEAIASGKPVVTHLWIDSCAQASCFIDEKKYILRDTKKEQELGFNMLVSLDCARKRPLLQGRRVLITPNTKPSKEIISGLVKAVHGQALERVGRSAFKDDKIPDDLLILSCEEDYGMCVPFLKKGAAIFTSELLLNGIVIQKLEYERHQLFVDDVKKTRSTIWLRKDGKNFEPVAKIK